MIEGQAARRSLVAFQDRAGLAGSLDDIPDVDVVVGTGGGKKLALGMPGDSAHFGRMWKSQHRRGLQVPYPNLGGLPARASQSPTVGAESDSVGDRPRGETLDRSRQSTVADFDRPVKVGHGDPPAVWAEVPRAAFFLGLRSSERSLHSLSPDAELGNDGILAGRMEPGGQKLAIGAELERPGRSSGVREPEQIAIVGHTTNVNVSCRRRPRRTAPVRRRTRGC